MGWVLPAVYQITLFRINYSPVIIKWVRELSFHYYRCYCSPTRKDASQRKFCHVLMSTQTCLNFVLR